MMSFSGLVLLAPLVLVSAEFYSDVDSREGDEAKALEIKAKDFWQGLMQSAEGLEASQNAELSARVELALKKLPAGYDGIRQQFEQSLGHLAKADSMLLEEASRSKMMALQRLQHGESREALCDFVSEWEDYLYTAYTKFVGYKSYEKKLERHIMARLKEVEPALERAAELTPGMYEENEKAEKSARALMLSRKLGHKKRDEALRDLAGEILSATGKQRMRFQDYLFNSLLTAAQDLSGQHEEPSQTVMKASLRGVDLSKGPSTPLVQVEAAHKEKEKATSPASLEDDHAPLIFKDGVPVDAEPIVLQVL